MISQYIQDAISRGSIIRVMFERGRKLKARYGADQVYDLTLGNPILEPPPEYFQALHELAELRDKGLHRYMPNVGFDFVRENIAQKLREQKILPDVTRENIIMTAGAACGLNVVLKAILNPGDEVIILAPYFVEYLHYVTGYQGNVVIANSHPDFSLDLDELASKITSKTRALIINSPNNPSGRVYPRSSLDALVELLHLKQKQYNTRIAIISDEPYREIVFDKNEVFSVASLYENSFVVYSWSKSLSIPGDRIGYVAFNPAMNNPRMLDALSFCLRLLGVVNAPAIMQWLVNKLLDVSIDVNYYQVKRDRIYQTLKGAGYDLIKPDGTFYVFPRAPGDDALAFMQKAMQLKILVVPGQGFGWPTHFRIAYCTDDHTIDRALEGLVELIHSV